MAVKQVIEIEGDSSDYVKAANKATEATQSIKKEAKKTTSVLGKIGKGGKKAFKGVGKAAKGLGKIIKGGLGLGFLLVAVGKITEIFSENQKVVDAVGKAFNVISTVVNEVTVALSDAFTAQNDLNGGFESTKAVVLGLLKIAIFPFQLAIAGITLGLQVAQRAFEESWLGDGDAIKVAELTADIDATKNKIVELTLALGDTILDVVDNVGGMVTEVGGLATAVVENVKEAVDGIDLDELSKDAQKLIDLRKAALEAEVKRQEIQIVAQRLAEIERQNRDDDKKSIDERIKANDRLLEIIQQQIKDEREQINVKIALARAEAKRTGSNEDNLALKSAELELLDLQERLEGQISEHKSNQNGLSKEALDIEKSKAQTILDVEAIQAQAALAGTDNALVAALIQKDIAQTLFDSKKKLLEDEAALYAEGTAARTEAENQLALLIAQKDAEDLARNIEIRNSKVAMAQSAITAISDLVTASAGASEQEAKRAFEINKALSLGSAIMGTAQAVTGALTAGGNALKLATGAQFVDAGIAAATGLAQIMTIKKTQFGGGVETSPNVPSLSSPSQPASFNIVGQGSLNQLNESIGQKFNQPLRAYVVGSDVNTEAELNRKRIKTATL